MESLLRCIMAYRLSASERRHSRAMRSGMTHPHHQIWPTFPQQQTRQRRNPPPDRRAEILGKCFKAWKASKGHPELTEVHTERPSTTVLSAARPGDSEDDDDDLPDFEVIRAWTAPCVDCGKPTQYCCDEHFQPCRAAQRMPRETWIQNQLTPLCTRCNKAWKMCRFCRADRMQNSDTNNRNALSGGVDILGQATFRGLDFTYTTILDFLQQQPLNVPDR